jgi:acetoin utilization deacetylase AcuC-like enzyme/GNAT superfamily N-acetyltransferase
VFSIRRVYDNTLAVDRDAITQVQNILRSQFSGLNDREITGLPGKLSDPLKHRFRSTLFVAEDIRRNQVKGFALLQHAPDLHFSFLDFISVDPKAPASGIGGALYQRVREEANSLASVGIFMECLPDDAKLCREPATVRQNKARLRFYERYGALPIINTAYETPLKPTDDCPPYLVFDGLGKNRPLALATAKEAVRAILIRKYGTKCPPGYIDMVCDSFRDDPVQLRLPLTIKTIPNPVHPTFSLEKRIALIVNDKHDIHHVRERGYVEAPVRIDSILKGIESTGFFDRLPTRHFPEKHIKDVHDSHFVEYLKMVCSRIPQGKSVYPYVFPIRNAARPPKELPVRAGYYCIDTFTPLNRNAYVAAKGAVDCALTAAEMLRKGYRLAYALVRPPGHHAERKAFGGFCYFNSSSIAANYLSGEGKVAVLDLDYHHGNGTQNIFYKRADIFTLSIHGHPSFAYPYFSGFSEEKGEGPGLGFNRNYPMPEELNGEQYRAVLARALKRLRAFKPKFLVVALGLDTARKDPTGTWSLVGSDFEKNGYMLGSLKLPTVVVQEGGYRTRSLGINARHFFCGLWHGLHDNNVC